MSDTDNPIFIPGNKEMSKLSPKQHFRKDKMPLILAGAGVGRRGRSDADHFFSATVP